MHLEADTMHAPIKTPDQKRKSPTSQPVQVTPEKDTNVIVEPNENDVLCGRGGSINSHPGNECFRELVEKRKRVYLTARFKREKRIIAGNIVSEIRNRNPSGRFLSRQSKDGHWYDIGDEKARDKTSQALRENAPSIRAEIETEINEQRAEMQRAEEKEAAKNGYQGYYPQAWGGGYWGAYSSYGYSDQSSPPPGPPPPPPPPPQQQQQQHSMPPPPPPYHSSYHEGPPPSYHPHGPPPSHHHGPPPPHTPSEQYHGQGNWQRPSSGPQPRHSYESQESQDRHYSPQHEQAPPTSHHRDPRRAEQHHASVAPPPSSTPSSGGDQGSAFDFVSSVPSSIAAWTKSSLGYGSETPSTEQQIKDDRKPEAHTSQHEKHGEKREVYYDERYGDKRQRCHKDNCRSRSEYYEPYGDHGSRDAGVEQYDRYEKSGYSTREEDRHKREGNRQLSYSPILDPEQASPRHDRGSSSLLAQAANHILSSWDINNMCTYGSADDQEFATSSRSNDDRVQPAVVQSSPEKIQRKTVREHHSEEGHEVEIVDMMDYEDPNGQEEDLPLPPIEEETRIPAPEEKGVRIDWSARAGCHSLLPDSTSLFENNKGNDGMEDDITPNTSTEMGGLSCPGSVGGGSLCQVFQPLGIPGEPSHPLPSPEMSHKDLSQMPSWEQMFRSKSPDTLASDTSLMSKESAKIAPSPPPSSSRRIVEGNTNGWNDDSMQE